MRILHLISSGGMYGAEAVILNLSHALAAAGHTSLLGAFSNADLTVLQRAREQGTEAHTVPCRGPLDRQLPSTLRRLLADTGADLVHAHGYKPDVYAALALHGRCPLVATCHTWYDNSRAERLYGALDRLLLRRFTRIVAVSAEVEHRLQASGLRPERIRRIPNGIDLTPFLAGSGGPHSPPHIGLVGRLAPEKGVDLFLEAAALVHRVHPAARFSVFGEGPLRSVLEAQRSTLNLEAIVTLPGTQTAMPPVFASLDLLVSASRQEGLPIALLEGMASGLPVVATSVGEIPSVVEPGRTGLLVPPGDPAALAEAILTLLHDPGLREAFGQAAQSRIRDHFSADRMAQVYLALYADALSGRSDA